MARGFPSMTALLGLLAIAGYQNRDKLGELLSGASGRSGLPGGSTGGLGGLLGGLGGGAGAAGAGGLLSGGLKELMDSFRQAGQGDKVESWVATGANKPCNAADLRSALGPDTIASLTQQTGLSEDELIDRLCRTLPEAVDRYTPEGRLPAA